MRRGLTLGALSQNATAMSQQRVKIVALMFMAMVTLLLTWCHFPPQSHCHNHSSTRCNGIHVTNHARDGRVGVLLKMQMHSVLNLAKRTKERLLMKQTLPQQQPRRAALSVRLLVVRHEGLGDGKVLPSLQRTRDTVSSPSTPVPSTSWYR
eukprot:3917592-Pyramimonas_sp.AAC.1